MWSFLVEVYRVFLLCPLRLRLTSLGLRSGERRDGFMFFRAQVGGGCSLERAIEMATPSAVEACDDAVDLEDLVVGDIVSGDRAAPPASTSCSFNVHDDLAAPPLQFEIYVDVVRRTVPDDATDDLDAAKQKPKDRKVGQKANDCVAAADQEAPKKKRRRKI